MNKQQKISQRWGMPFWHLVSDLAAQDLTRRDTARALGFDDSYFYTLLAEHPEQDPFPPYHVVHSYVKDSGETFREALERMIDLGWGVSAIAVAMGFKRTNSLHYAMKVRGINLKFKPVSRKVKPRTLRTGPYLSTGWPTWEQVYAMGQTARNRKEGGTTEDSCDKDTVPHDDGAAPDISEACTSAVA